MTPFDFVNSVSSTKKDIFTDKTEADYVPFIVNRALSYHVDAILAANLMNLYNELPKRAQYTFFLNTLRSRKRFAKWIKKENDETVLALKKAFSISEQDARIALNLLSKEQLEQLLEQKDIGGVNE